MTDPTPLTGWAHCQEVTPFRPGATLTDPVVSIWLGDPTVGDLSDANADLSDLRFTDLANNPLYFQFDEATQNPQGGVINVRLPSWSSSADTPIVMHWGNPAASDAQSTDVWTSAAGIWHLGNGTTLSAADSGPNGNNGTVNGGAHADTGVIGGGASFDGTGDDITVPHNNTLNVGGGTAAAWMFWSNGTGRVLGKSTETVKRYGVTFRAGPLLEFATYDGSWHAVDSDTLTITGWHHYAVVWDLTNITFYQDGVAKGARSFSSASFPASTAGLRIGSNLASAANSNVYYFTGLMDEVQILGRAPTAAEIAAHVYNVTQVGHGLTWGNVIDAGGGVVEESLTLSAVAGISVSGSVQASDSLTLSSSALMTLLANAAGNDSLTLSSVAALLSAGAAEGQDNISLDAGAGVSASGVAVTEAALVMAARVILSGSANVVASDAVSLTVVAGLLATYGTVYEDAITLSAQAGMSVVESVIANAHLTLSQAASIGATAVALSNAGLTITGIASLSATASIITVGFTLPAGRTITVTLENRVVQVAAESRIITVPAETRIITVPKEED
jgi:Concanavalin A-like lectin/glucanases superfamily/Domain of unknown function (DUF2341)